MKTALVTGITGQDGAYLAELLLEQGLRGPRHQAPRLARSTPTGSTTSTRTRTSGAAAQPALRRPDGRHQPDPHRPAGAARRDLQPRRAEPRGGVLRDARVHGQCRRARHAALLEAIRILGLEKKTRFYQASTSEMYGKVQEIPQKETTPFYPRSPYGAAKVYAYWITVNYREAYGMFACNGILFNHESPLRGETFVTRKITRGLARIKEGLDRSACTSATWTPSATGATRETT